MKQQPSPFIDRVAILESIKPTLAQLGVDCGTEEILSGRGKSHLVFTRAIIAHWLTEAGYKQYDIAYIVGKKTGSQAAYLQRCWQPDFYWGKLNRTRKNFGFFNDTSKKIFELAKTMRPVPYVNYRKHGLKIAQKSM